MNKQQFNVYLPDGLIREIKHAAIDVEESLSQFVETSLAQRLKQSEGSTEMVSLMPIVYVTQMKKSLTFYKALGAQPIHTGQMWSQLTMGDSSFALHGIEKINKRSNQMGLALTAHQPLENIIKALKSKRIKVEGDIVDEAFGRSMLIHDPDGLPIQINEHDPTLYK